MRESSLSIQCGFRRESFSSEIARRSASGYGSMGTVRQIANGTSSVDASDEYRLSPERGNVAFASTQMGWCFTLKTFAAMYAQTYGSFDVDDFAARLWGNIYYDTDERKFTRKPADMDTKRSFVHFVLEPLYKLYTQVRLTKP